MSQPKRIFLVADFKHGRARAIRAENRHWIKGFMRLGHDVQCFSYIDMVAQLAPVKFGGIMLKLGKKKADEVIAEQIRYYHPDIVMIITMKDMDGETVAGMKKVAPNAIFVGRDIDWFLESDINKIEVAKKMDIVMNTDAGEFLKAYKKLGVPRCAFIPCLCDPDIQRPYDVDEKFRSDIIFAGKATHGQGECDDDRFAIVERLSRMPNAKVYGAFGQPAIDGLDCFYALGGAKIALSINAVNNVRLYHSDRFINSLSCGAFVLAKRVPDTDMLFQDGVHLRYFDTADEFFELADWYLKHDAERVKIARAGMERAHNEFNCVKMAEHAI
ncbi:MAG TPA: glycosyltransferase, partial [Phycisphaerae bacterium]|nr:glycosyltransferase [Phycisphaerae bacterium]